MLIKATAIVKFSGIYKWDIINPLKDCLKNGKPIKNEQLGYECNVFDLFIHDATKAFVNAEFKLKIGVILPVTEEQFIEANKNIKEIVNTDTAIINCGAYGKGRIYHDEDVTIRQNALQCIYELTNKILDMQVKDKYLNPIVVDINQK